MKKRKALLEIVYQRDRILGSMLKESETCGKERRRQLATRFRAVNRACIKIFKERIGVGICNEYFANCNPGK